MAKPILHNMDKWVAENKQQFHPPICNKLMHDIQMKCFFVGGPNVRKDYHLEEGPEFFYMKTGDMCLKIKERNKPRDVIIKQGEVFMLPPRIPHSPQRKADTVGLVIERERMENETDGLKYYVEKDNKPTSEVLYESWFHCVNLGPQLASAINAYFDTEQSKTGVPKPGTILSEDEAPFKIDDDKEVMAPFSLEQWLIDNKERIESEGSLNLFEETVPGTQVKVHGAGSVSMELEKTEVFIWVLHGSCAVSAMDNETALGVSDTLWIPANTRFVLNVEDTSSRVFMLSMAPPSP